MCPPDKIREIQKRCDGMVAGINRAVDLVRTTKMQKIEIAQQEGLPRAVIYRIGNAQVRIDLFYTDTEAPSD
jgi:hypothetical protein